MNKKNKLIISIILFLNFIVINAFDANITINKTETDINDYINLRIVINSEKWWEIWITNIVWLDKFEIISQSQSQSTSTNIIINNWKRENITKTSFNLDLVLKANEKWDYIIWPAYLKNDWKEVDTNTVSIIVSWDNLFINNNHLQIPTNTKVANNVNNLQKNNEEEKIADFINVEKKEFKNNNTLYILLWVILFIWWLFYYLSKNWYFLDYKKKNIDDSKKEIKNYDEKLNLIKIPDIWDSNFIKDISKIFTYKLWNKYNIEHIDTLTFDEILNKISDKESVIEIIEKLNKAKYSNLDWDNEILLEMINKI